MSAKSKAVLIEAIAYIRKYHREIGVKIKRKDSQEMGERFMRNWRKEYIHAGDELLRLWLDKRRGKNE